MKRDGNSVASPSPVKRAIVAMVMAVFIPIAPDAIGLFFFSGCSLSLCRSAMSFMT